MGMTVAEFFSTDHNFPNRQTYVFSALFADVIQVTWQQDNGYPRPSQQFDNIVVTPNTQPVPEPATGALLALGIVGRAMTRRQRMVWPLSE